MSQHVLIIGAVALGPKAACRFKRLEPDSVVTMIDKDTRISYGGCGIPYFVSGDVSAASELTTTSFHMVRDTAFFRDVKGVEVRTGLEALAIDRAGKTVRVRDLASGKEEDLSYDKLVVATGSAPRVLPVPGHDLPGVHVVANLEAAESIRAAVTAGGVEKAVVIGAGFVGLEMAEALSDMWDVETTVIEAAPRIMVNNLGPALSAMALKHITDKGLPVLLSETVTAIEGQGRVQRVVTNKRTIEADLVIMAAGVIPNSELAARAGLTVSGRGGIVVDAAMRTSDPDIFAGGDCVEVPHLVTGKPFSLPMGSMANRQGRVIGDNLAGGASVFRGAAGSFAIKLFERAVSGTGLTLEQAKREGLDAISALVVQLDRAHFYPGKELLTLELVVERGTRRVLGIQGMGASGDALVGRVGAVAAMMPFSPPWRTSAPWNIPTPRPTPRPWTSSTPWATWPTTSWPEKPSASRPSTSPHCGRRGSAISWIAGNARMPLPFWNASPRGGTTSPRAIWPGVSTRSRGTATCSWCATPGPGPTRPTPPWPTTAGPTSKTSLGAWPPCGPWDWTRSDRGPVPPAGALPGRGRATAGRRSCLAPGIQVANSILASGRGADWYAPALGARCRGSNPLAPTRFFIRRFRKRGRLFLRRP